MTDAMWISTNAADWNALASPWIGVVRTDGIMETYSPLNALRQASTIRCLAAADPLDLFSAHRFLLTLLYWKADLVGGIVQLRKSLRENGVPAVVLKSLESDTHYFRLFDEEAPFFQDATRRDTAERSRKSAGSLFSELASGTNIAHFHHGDDQNTRLCAKCATEGMMRLVPWTQSGGRGLTPAVHGAPPIMILATGEDLSKTLGLNLVPLPAESGTATWTGNFVPSDRAGEIRFLEALTWNPRRVHLGAPEPDGTCSRCGRDGIPVVGPIVYAKNDETAANRRGRQTLPFHWRDPSALYAAERPYVTVKSTNEKSAATGQDLVSILNRKDPLNSLVVEANPGHEGWKLIIPCTDGRAKTFDHREVDILDITRDAIQTQINQADATVEGMDGWVQPVRAAVANGAAQFVETANRLLTHADWATLSVAAFREMDGSPAAFDILSGLLWPLRGRGRALPGRNVAWLVLKLMAAVPARARAPDPNAAFSPLHHLPRRQIAGSRHGRSDGFRYPISFPRGHQLEASLRTVLHANMRRRTPKRVDWIGLCQDLNRLLV